MPAITIGEVSGRDVKLDLETLISTRLLIQANSGGGKSYALRRLMEQAFGKVQIICIDPEGEFATLREKFGFVLAGPGGDTPADIRSAGMLAQKLLELNASAVCDIYELRSGQRHVWVRSFLEALINAPKKLWHPCLVIVDEAHVFCPEKGQGESEALGAMTDLCTRGRKRGFCAVFATQRLGKLSKNASAELQNRLIGPTFEDIDRERAAKLLGILKSDSRKFMHDIQLLDPGNFFAIGRAISRERILVKIGKVQTSHPEAGAKLKAPPPPPDSVAKLLPQLGDLPKQAEEKAKTEAELRQEIRSLEARLRSAPRAEVDPRAIETAVKAATRPLIVEIDRMRKLAQNAGVYAKHVIEKIESLQDVTHVTTVTTATAPIPVPRTPVPISEPRPIATPDGEDPVTAPQMRIVQAAADFHAIGMTMIPKNWLAARSKQSHRSSSYDINLRKLRERGLLDYGDGGIFLTAEGKEFAGSRPAPLTAEEMANSCRAILSEAERRIFDVLHSRYPQFVKREDLAQLAGASPTSSSFDINLRNLKSAGMLEYGAERSMRMQKWVFLESVVA